MRQPNSCKNSQLALSECQLHAGDPLGYLDVSPAGVRQRDLMVWRAALEHRVPVVQLLSGGYTQASTTCIADCIEALFKEFDLGGRM